MFRRKIPTFSPKFLNFNKRYVSTKEFVSNLDNKLNWFIKTVVPTKSIAVFLAGVNLALFLYSNVRTTSYKRWEAIRGVSYSLNDFRKRDLIPLITSLLGSRNVEDFIFETGVLLTIGNISTLFFILKFIR